MQTILLVSGSPFGNSSLIVKWPVGFIHESVSPSLALNNSVVNLPGNGFLTHLITNSKNFLFSGCDAIVYALISQKKFA